VHKTANVLLEMPPYLLGSFQRATVQPTYSGLIIAPLLPGLTGGLKEATLFGHLSD